MKSLPLFGLLFITLLFGCSDDDVRTVEYTLASPITIPVSDVRTSIAIEAPRDIVQSGKMYVYQNYVFVNDRNLGVHIIDNSNPASPQKLKFLKIPGNEDISIKDNRLFADSYVDLVVFDISNINSIQLINRLENVFDSYDFDVPEEADTFTLEGVDLENEIIIDWTLSIESYEVSNDISVLVDVAATDVGIGGSLARFQIVENYLYAVDVFELDVFDISNLSNPVAVGNQGIAWDIETLFYAEDYLYIGSAGGVYIYDLVDPSNPNYVSEVRHVLGCDPVVVQGDYAYVTIRGGNFCGQQLSQLEVINISNKFNPYVETIVTLDEPYGLGVRNNSLYVSDGEAGLKLFNIEDPVGIFLETEFPDIVIFDVIPMEDKLLLIGENKLYQYSYTEGGLTLISTFSLD